MRPCTIWSGLGAKPFRRPRIRSRRSALAPGRSGFYGVKLTLYTDYALRVLIYLGAHGETLATIREIAACYGVSRHHLTKICQDLQQRGYIETVRGKHGGIRLARRPREIVVGQVVRDMEEHLEVVECLGGDDSCIITQACRLQEVLREALGAFTKTLDRYTLADMLQPRNQLQSLLGVPIRCE